MKVCIIAILIGLSVLAFIIPFNPIASNNVKTIVVTYHEYEGKILRMCWPNEFNKINQDAINNLQIITTVLKINQERERQMRELAIVVLVVIIGFALFKSGQLKDHFFDDYWEEIVWIDEDGTEVVTKSLAGTNTEIAFRTTHPNAKVKSRKYEKYEQPQPN